LKFNGQSPRLSLILTVIFFGGLVLPLIITFLGSFKEFEEFKKITIKLKKLPYDKLSKIGFTEIFEASEKGGIVRPVLSGKIDGYPLTIEYEFDKIIFKAKTNFNSSNKQKSQNLKAVTGYNEVGFETKFDTTSIDSLTFSEIEVALKEFTEFLKTEKLDPWKINASA
jgi:hypothetical protein